VDFKKKKDQDSKDFVLCIDKAYVVFDIYYMKIDMSPLYTTALILNPACRTRYIETNWPKKWLKPTLVKVKKLWEKYREEVIPTPTIVPFSYDNPSRELRELDAFD
jgi:hypothetical protein